MQTKNFALANQDDNVFGAGHQSSLFVPIKVTFSNNNNMHWIYIVYI